MEIISHSYKHKPIPINQCVDRENKKKEEEKGQRKRKKEKRKEEVEEKERENSRTSVNFTEQRDEGSLKDCDLIIGHYIYCLYNLSTTTSITLLNNKWLLLLVVVFR